MGTETRYCALVCHDFTVHDVGPKLVRCLTCLKVALCSTCKAIQIYGHACPQNGWAKLYCGYCGRLRDASSRDGGQWWRCEYCTDSITCRNCGHRWTENHDCIGNDGPAVDDLHVTEIEITIAPGVVMSLAIPVGTNSRVKALAPRLHAGPTYRAPVERALLTMDRLVRSGGDGTLALDMLHQAESLAETG